MRQIREQMFIRTNRLPECRCSILDTSPVANLKSPVYNTVPREPSNRNLSTDTNIADEQSFVFAKSVKRKYKLQSFKKV